MDESRNEELSHRYSVPPSRMRFRPWTKMLRPGSYEARKQGVGLVRYSAIVQESASDVLQASVPTL
jgi:hypothetical protein